MTNVEIYTTAMCGFCSAAKRLLDAKGVEFIEKDVSSDQETRAQMIDRSGGRRTVPQIFINGEHVGGCDDLYALEQQGKLDSKLSLY
ncbi:MAG: glutaredoxin 3 [Alphaproteobacteria bacterium]|jgi:glutaredoxin 3|nr:glutaredoxin 3 [Alphaproteobacteria bacterium]PPR14524.1 MAG: Glutaredoxin-3 [Alphaproteobacteria bacterium MarineAlpha12_Bin1]